MAVNASPVAVIMLPAVLDQVSIRGGVPRDVVIIPMFSMAVVLSPWFVMVCINAYVDSIVSISVISVMIGPRIVM